MELNADFSLRVSVHPKDNPWRASPMAGVERQMLDRLGDEVARATSIVRYVPGSSFPAHTHTGGEEFIVLEGVFQDEHGDFPVGSYVRNPPGSKHVPGAAEGAVILVKLWQFDPEDKVAVRLQTNDMTALPNKDRQGVAEIPLFQDRRENVRIEVWKPNTEILIEEHKGMEILVIADGFVEGGESFAERSWLRLPVDHPLDAVAGPNGARLWIKSDHLAETPRPPSV